MNFLQPKTYFNESKLQPKDSFVLMLDIMGTQNIMSQSLSTSANFVFKFHSVLNMYKKKDISICPIMDGAYVAAENCGVMRKFIHDVLFKLCSDFVQEFDCHRQYMVRGSLAYGPVITGCSIAGNAFDKAVRSKKGWRAYANSLIIGAPVIQAFSSEKAGVPPFGIYVHESARDKLFPADLFPFKPKWYKWWDISVDAVLLRRLKSALDRYFAEYERHSYSSSYPKNKIVEHKGMVEDYFSLKNFPRKKRICPRKYSPRRMGRHRGGPSAPGNTGRGTPQSKIP